MQEFPFLVAFNGRPTGNPPFLFGGGGPLKKDTPKCLSSLPAKTISLVLACWQFRQIICQRSAVWRIQDVTLTQPTLRNPASNSVAFLSPAKSLTFSGLMENPLVGKKLKSQHPSKCTKAKLPLRQSKPPSCHLQGLDSDGPGAKEARRWWLHHMSLRLKLCELC